VTLGLAVVLMGAGVGASGAAQLTPPAGMTLVPNNAVNVVGVLEGPAVTSTPSRTPFQTVAAETGGPGSSATPPPTSAIDVLTQGTASSPLFALLICLLLALFAVFVAERQRRSRRL